MMKYSLNVIRQWNVEKTIVLTDASLAVNVQLNALMLKMSQRSIQVISSITTSICEYYTFYNYRKLRPQVRVSGEPREWWKYALGCIEREFNHQNQLKHWHTNISSRRNVRLNYIKNYSNYQWWKQR